MTVLRLLRRRADRAIDDSGSTSIAAMVLVLVVIGGGGLVHDGGRALAARRDAINLAEASARAGAATVTSNGLNELIAEAAARDYLLAAGVAEGDIRQIEANRTHIVVVVRATRSPVFTQLLGNESIVVYGSGEAAADFGGG